MSTNEYPLVRVQGAPGWEDFTGRLIMELPFIDGRMMSVVGWGWEDPNGLGIFPSTLVTRLEEAE